MPANFVQDQVRFRIHMRLHWLGSLEPDTPEVNSWIGSALKSVCRIRKSLGLTDPDPLDRGKDPDPDPPIFKQKL
jgi:hypothetical protein